MDPHDQLLKKKIICFEFTDNDRTTFRTAATVDSCRAIYWQPPVVGTDSWPYQECAACPGRPA